MQAFENDQQNVKYMWFVVKELIANTLVWSVNVQHLCYVKLLSPVNSAYSHSVLSKNQDKNGMP